MNGTFLLILKCISLFFYNANDEQTHNYVYLREWYSSSVANHLTCWATMFVQLHCSSSYDASMRFICKHENVRHYDDMPTKLGQDYNHKRLSSLSMVTILKQSYHIFNALHLDKINLRRMSKHFGQCVMFVRSNVLILIKINWRQMMFHRLSPKHNRSNEQWLGIEVMISMHVVPYIGLHSIISQDISSIFVSKSQWTLLAELIL